MRPGIGEGREGGHTGKFREMPPLITSPLPWHCVGKSGSVQKIPTVKGLQRASDPIFSSTKCET